jgi:NADH dehydrogenase
VAAARLNAVTGVFSYTGRAIAEELLARGEAVRSLSRRDAPDDPLRARVEVAPLAFDGASLAGARTLYNTYWIRFERGGATFDRAVANTIALFGAAGRAGVERIVHVSVSNPERARDLPYFAGKLRIEEWLAASGIPHAIVRPTLVFGPEDILVNNIAWILRRLPVFVVPSGEYEVQPVSVGDVARICVEAVGTVDAAGPERLSFLELVEHVRGAVGSRARIVPGSPTLALALVRAASLALRDVVLTREELAGLRRSLLTSDEPPLGRDGFAAWVEQNGHVLGRRYVSELARNFRGQV